MNASRSGEDWETEVKARTRCPVDRPVLGRHDILNDVSHRSVAAAILPFLEQRRVGDGQPDILRTLDLREQ